MGRGATGSGTRFPHLAGDRPLCHPRPQGRRYGRCPPVGLDETRSRRGHDYLTLFVDLPAKRLLFATPGKDAHTVQAFAEDLQAHGGDPLSIEEVSMDLSPAFQKGVTKYLPNARITFDRFRLMKLVNEAVDQVRRLEAPSQPDIQKTRCIWLKNLNYLKATLVMTHQHYLPVIAKLDFQLPLKNSDEP